MTEKTPTCNRLVDDINELNAEIKRLRLHIFSQRECKNGYKGDWCSSCDFFSPEDEICIVDQETALIYADEIETKR